MYVLCIGCEVIWIIYEGLSGGVIIILAGWVCLSRTRRYLLIPPLRSPIQWCWYSQTHPHVIMHIDLVQYVYVYRLRGHLDNLWGIEWRISNNLSRVGVSVTDTTIPSHPPVKVTFSTVLYWYSWWYSTMEGGGGVQSSVLKEGFWCFNELKEVCHEIFETPFFVWALDKQFKTFSNMASIWPRYSYTKFDNDDCAVTCSP